jgi:hypothetical protein
MNTHRISQSRILPLFIFASIAGIGCAANVDTGDVGNAVASEGELVFDTSWSDTGRFQVRRFADGTLSARVVGTIGKDDPHTILAKDSGSMAETYRLLKGESVAPDVLLELDKQARTAEPRDPSAAPRALHPNTYSDWYNAECVNQPLAADGNGCSGQGYFWPVACYYSGSDSGTAVNSVNVQGFNSYDRTYYWNDSSSAGKSGVNNSYLGFYYYWNESAHSWNYTWWYNGIISNWWARFELNSGNGNLGVTIHRKACY